jgi:predicted ATP-dependent protease
MNSLARGAEKSLALALCAGLLAGPADLRAQTVSRAAPVPIAALAVAPAGGLAMDLGHSLLPAPAGIETLAAQPLSEALRALRLSGTRLPEQARTVSDAVQLRAAAEVLPQGLARQKLLEMAAAAEAPKGSNEAPGSGALFDTNGVRIVADGLLPVFEVPGTGGVWELIAKSSSRLIPSALRKAAFKRTEESRAKVLPIGEEKFRVSPDKLGWAPDASALPESTREMEAFKNMGIVGQDRALESLRFGLKMPGSGFNVVATGPDGSGRETAVRALLGAIAPSMPTPPDIVKMPNQENGEEPIVFELPAGRGGAFKAAVEKFCAMFERALPQAFKSSPDMARLKAETLARRKELDESTAQIKIGAGGRFGLSVVVREGEGGMAHILIAPTVDGKSLTQKEFQKMIESGKLDEKEWEAAQQEIEALSPGVIEQYQKMMEEVGEKGLAIQGAIAAALAQELGREIVQSVKSSGEESGAEKKFKAAALARQKDLLDKFTGRKLGKFSVSMKMARTPKGLMPMAFIEFEGREVDDQGLSDLVKSGKISQGDADALNESLVKMGAELLAGLNAMMLQNKKDMADLKAQEPKPSPEVEKALEHVKGMLSHAGGNYMGFLAYDEGNSPKDRYQIEVLVDNSKALGAPVIVEKVPSRENLFGSAEHKAKIKMVPNVGAVRGEAAGGPKLKAGSFHKANGGFLVLDLQSLISEPGAWFELMKALRNGSAEIVDEMGIMGRGGAYGVPSKVKVVLIGSPTLVMLVRHYEDQFSNLFGALAEFESSMKIGAQAVAGTLDFMKNAIAAGGGALLEMSRGALRETLRFGSKITGDNRELTTQFGAYLKLMREATFWAKDAGSDTVEAEHVLKALSERKERQGSFVRAYKERLEDNVFMVATDGWVVGQDNGLAVMGGYFGSPIRISATVSAGRRGLFSGEQAAHFSGQSFDKAFSVVNGFIKNTFAKKRPLEADIDISFEQNYGIVDGDSATSTKIYAVLSALSGAPIYQGIAMTGSADQFGNVQAIGGVNEKITGFFALAKFRGLNGHQGVIIPAANLSELQLDEEIVEAVKAGKFHIWAVSHVSQGIEILTGTAYAEVLHKAALRLAELRKG